MNTWRTICWLPLVWLMTSSCTRMYFNNSTFLLDKNPIAKPVYKENTTNDLWRVSGTFLREGRSFYYDPIDPLYRNDSTVEYFNDVRSKHEVGKVELTYGKSHEYISYGIGGFATIGQYTFFHGDRDLKSLSTAGLGGKVNISFDVNRESFTWRVLELQLSLSQGYGGYEVKRAQLAADVPNGYFRDYKSVYPENTAVGGYLFSTVLLWKGEKLITEVSLSAGSDQPIQQPNGYKIQNEFGSLQLLFAVKRFDMFGSLTIAELGVVGGIGIGYRF